MDGRGTYLADQTEIDKYSSCYRQRNYRMGKRNCQRALKDIQSIPPESTFLDVGCGRGETILMAIEQELRPHGIEIVPELCDGKFVSQGDITDLPEKCYDYVACYDVLEHLPIWDIEKALDNLFMVATKALFITTNDREANRAGMVLHLTRRPQDWWEHQFALRGYDSIEHTIFATERDWHWRINSPNARAERTGIRQSRQQGPL